MRSSARLLMRVNESMMQIDGVQAMLLNPLLKDSPCPSPVNKQAVFITRRTTRTQNVFVVIIPCEENGCARHPAGGTGRRLFSLNESYAC
jgi:hypothetical protein